MRMGRSRPRHRGGGIPGLGLALGIVVAVSAAGLAWISVSGSDGAPEERFVTVRPVEVAVEVDTSMAASIRTADELISQGEAGDEFAIMDRDGKSIYSGRVPAGSDQVLRWRESTRKLLPMILNEPGEASCSERSGWALSDVRQLIKALDGDDVPKVLVLPGDAAADAPAPGLRAGELSDIVVVAAPWNNACNEIGAVEEWLQRGTPLEVVRISVLEPPGTLSAKVAQLRADGPQIHAKVESALTEATCAPGLLVALHPGTAVDMTALASVAQTFHENAGGEIMVIVVDSASLRASLAIEQRPPEVPPSGGSVILQGRKVEQSDSRFSEALSLFRSQLAGAQSVSGGGSANATAAVADAFVRKPGPGGSPRCAYVIVEAGRTSDDFIEAMSSTPRALFVVGSTSVVAVHVLGVPDIETAFAEVKTQEDK